MPEGQAEIGDLLALATIRRILLELGHQLQPEPPGIGSMALSEERNILIAPAWAGRRGEQADA